MARTKNMNAHQKRAFRPGEKRKRTDEIWHYVDLSKSDDPAERLEAAQNLCPCHVRRRVDEAWDALYRMMEDPDEKVRAAAYHTLEDGGRPDDPQLLAIFDRAWENETSECVLHFLRMFTKGREERELIELDAKMIGDYPDCGKCDFCGDDNVPVRHDFETEIPGNGGARAAWVCASCDG